MNKFISFSNTRILRKPLNVSASANDGKVLSGNRSALLGKARDTVTEETALIRSARQGDLQAFNRIVIAYQDRAYTMAYYLLGDSKAAEDIVQEAFITIYKELPNYRDGSFKSLLIRMVMDKCLDKLRHWKGHQITTSETIDARGEEIESSTWSVNPGEALEECSIRTEPDRYLLLYLDRLDAKDRTALVLVDILDLDYGEAAEVMGCSMGAFKSHLAWARFQMQHFIRNDPSITCS
jgi:RNA polymerase sigma-70 factor (ECF subfamily)